MEKKMETTMVYWGYIGIAPACCPSRAGASAFARVWLLRRSLGSRWSLRHRQLERKPANITLGFRLMGRV